VALFPAAFAEGKGDIFIGQSADQSGPQKAAVAEMTAAARAYFDKINKAGGVDGRKIVLVSIDDGFDPKRSAAAATELITQKNVLALALSRGTANAEAVMVVANEAKVPVIGYVAGSLVLHTPPTRYFFNLRPPYRIESERAIGQLKAQGAANIATVYTDDAFGKDVLQGVQAGLKANNMVAAAVAMIPRGETKVDAAVATIVDSNADSVIGLCIPKICATLVKNLRAAGYRGRFLSLSNTSSSSYVKELDQHARGVIVTQVFPAPDSVAMAVSNDFQKLADEYKFEKSYTSMEGFVNARVVVEAIRRAGPNPSREGVVRALESMRSFDLGGFVIGFGPDNRTGSTVVNLTIIGRDGRFMR
jgi:branched-chain amino acid transport system substrate-binding protein